MSLDNNYSRSRNICAAGTIGNLLEISAEKYGKNKAIINYDRCSEITYEKLYDISRKYAAALIGMGLKKGDHIALWANNINEWIYLMFGAAMTGITIVTVNTGYRSYELEYLLRQSDSKALFTISGLNYPDEYFDILNDLWPELKSPDRISNLINPKLPLVKHIINIGHGEKNGIISLEEFLNLGGKISEEELDRSCSEVSGGDCAMILYTSGTTGYPKGVIDTHKNLTEISYIISEHINMSSNDIQLIIPPLFHCHGCINGLLAPISRGGSVVLIEKPNPEKMIDAITKYNCTSITAVPASLIALAGQFEKHKIGPASIKLKRGVVSGAACPPDIMKKMIYEFGMTELCVAYGQTETNGITAVKIDADERAKTETIGVPIKGVEVKIINPATGENTKCSVPGEICCRISTLKGYYKMPEATEKLIDSNGWVHTGDIGSCDEAGNYRILGRLKEMIITGGENIYPREIEEFLMGNPKIVNAQVVGVPSKIFGEKVVAFIQLKNNEICTEAELKNFCRNKIAQFKIPVKFYFVDDYPKTASGKVQKFKLVEMAEKNQAK